MSPELMYLALLKVQQMQLADPEVWQRAATRQDRSPGTLRRRLGNRLRPVRVRPVPIADGGAAA